MLCQFFLGFWVPTEKHYFGVWIHSHNIWRCPLCFRVLCRCPQPNARWVDACL